MSLPSPWKPPASTQADENAAGRPQNTPALRPRMLLGGAVLVLLLAGVGGMQWYHTVAAPPPVVLTRLPHVNPALPDKPPLPSPSSPGGAAPGSAPAAAVGAAPAAPPRAASEVSDSIMVHVVGAVRKPGVYRLPPKARLIDAVHAAGGPKAGADLEAVDLAYFVQDGEQIRVPMLSERRLMRAADAAPHAAARPAPAELLPRPTHSTARYPLQEAAPSAAAPEPLSDAGASSKKDGGLVDINTAGEAELETLPGVGPKTAAAILAFRQEHGPFQRPEDLMDVRGIGEKKLARMRDRVVIR